MSSVKIKDAVKVSTKQGTFLIYIDEEVSRTKFRVQSFRDNISEFFESKEECHAWIRGIVQLQDKYDKDGVDIPA